MAVTIDGLEIHHVGIAGGDATVIAVNYRVDGTEQPPVRVLIDAGGESFADGPLRLASYVAAHFGTEPFDFAIASHYHADHIAGFQRCGINFVRVVDMGGYAVGNTRFEPVNPLGDLSEDSGVLKQYEYHVGDRIQSSNGARSRLNLPFIQKSNFSPDGATLQGGAGPVEIRLVPGSADVTLTCYCAGGVLANGTNVLRSNVRTRLLRSRQRKEDESDLTAEEKQRLGELTTVELGKVSPNDLSLAFILQWNDFRYWTAGDLSGDLSLTRYANVEEPLVEYLRGTADLANRPITVMKATHHGSNHNNYPASITRTVNFGAPPPRGEDDEAAPVNGVNKEFRAKNGKGLLDELKPETIVVPCNQMKGVPGGEFVTRLQAYCSAAQDQRTLTAAFVNECVYPQPQYAGKQKATREQLEAFMKKLAERTNLTVASGGDEAAMSDDEARPVTNGGDAAKGPRVVVIHVPARARDAPLAEGNQVTHKATHSVVVDNGAPALHDIILNAGESGQQLPELASIVRNRVRPLLRERAEQLIALNNVGTAGLFLAGHFPAVAGAAGGLQPADQAGLATTLQNLFDKAYPNQDAAGNYQPANTSTSPNERTTVYSLIYATPRVSNTPNDTKNVLGQEIFDEFLDPDDRRVYNTAPVKRQKTRHVR